MILLLKILLDSSSSSKLDEGIDLCLEAIGFEFEVPIFDVRATAFIGDALEVLPDLLALLSFSESHPAPLYREHCSLLSELFLFIFVGGFLHG